MAVLAHHFLLQFHHYLEIGQVVMIAKFLPYSKIP